MVINNFVYQWPRSILVCFPCNACDALYSLIFRIVRALIPFVVVLLLSSCRVLVPDRMFRNGEFQQFVSDKNNMEDYSIRPGDVIRVQLYTQDGFPILDALRMESSQGGQGSRSVIVGTLVSFLVTQDGYVDLPIFGETYVQGMKDQELEQFLEQRGAELFVNPFAIVSVLGRRCMVFRGGKAAIIPLETRPTTLLEVIARSGGLNQYDRADKIQVIRGDLNDPLLYEIDLSEISGLKDGGMIVQSNDIIYIRSRPRVLARASNEISTVTSLLLSSSSLLTTILLLRQQ